MPSRSPLRILACWPYARGGWVKPLESLADRGHDVTYLAYRDERDEPAITAIPSDRRRAYWHQFRSGQEILRRIRPDRVVFMGLEGAWQLALNFAARRQGVPTILLEHGRVAEPDEYAALSSLVAGSPAVGFQHRIPAARFVARSMVGRPLQLFGALRYLLNAARATPWEVAPAHHLSARRADVYLTASPASAQFHRFRDGVDPDRIQPVGLSEYDDYFRLALPPASEDRALLIDTTHTGGPHRRTSISVEAKSERYRELGRDLHGHGWHLSIKLHPSAYDQSWPRSSDGLTYLRDIDLIEELLRTRVVVGFDSTLLLPALHHRPGLLLTSPGRPSRFQERALECGAVPPPLPLSDVSAEDVIRAATGADATAVGRAALVGEAIGATDGHALDRIEAALMEPPGRFLG